MHRKRNNCNIGLASIIKQTREGNDLSIARSARDDGPRRSGLRIMLACPLLALAISALFSNSASAAMLATSISLSEIESSRDNTLANVHPTSGEPAFGQYKSTFQLTANNVKDYAIYASTPDSNLVGTKDSNNKIPSMGSTQAINAEAIKTNTWGFRASFDSEPTNYYTGVPVLAVENQENKEALESTAKYIGGDNVSYNTPVSRNIYLDVATRIDATIPADTYTGQVVLSAVATPAGATIFDINSMQEMTPEICSNTITPTTNAAIPALAGGDSYNVAVTNKQGRKEIVYDMNNRTEVGGEPRTTIAVETTLEDLRDGKRYLVAKLADGRCWMIQNLTLQSNDSKPKTILAYNSTDGATFAYSLPKSSMEGFRDSDTGFMYNGSFQANMYNTQGYAGGQAKNDPNCNGNSPAGCNGSNSGSYYSWQAAVANSTASITKYDNAPSSICPKGWKLPSTSDRESDNSVFQALYNSYGSYDAVSRVWHGGDKNNTATTFAGAFNADTLQLSGARALWWSSTVLTDTYAYSLSQDTSDFLIANGNIRYNGYFVRCVAATEDPTPVTAKTMQEFSKADCSNLTGETELIDSRDNKVYKVAKLEDGNCWMIQNLALEGGTMLTPEKSDVTSNYPLPESSTTGFSDNSTAYVYNGTHIGRANDSKQIIEHAAYDTNGYDGTTTNDGSNSGAYYSWVAAKAGKANADESICPAGWKLPSGGASGQFQALYNKYGNYDTFSTIWHGGDKDNASISFTGNFSQNKLYNSGDNAYWWSSTAFSNTHAYDLNQNNTPAFDPMNYDVAHRGLSVRCVKTSN